MNFPLLSNFRIGQQVSPKPSIFNWVAAQETNDVSDQTAGQPDCYTQEEPEADQSALLREMEYFDRF